MLLVLSYQVVVLLPGSLQVGVRCPVEWIATILEDLPLRVSEGRGSKWPWLRSWRLLTAYLATEVEVSGGWLGTGRAKVGNEDGKGRSRQGEG